MWTADLAEGGEECFQHISCRIKVSETTVEGATLAPVTIGTMGLWRLRPALDISEWMIEMSWISQDFSNIVDVLLFERERDEPRFSIYGEPDDAIIVAHVVSLDPFWRGAGIGPAMVRQVAHEFQAEMAVLEPHPIAVRLNEDGEPDCDFENTRATDYARAKVRRAWRRAGYRPVGKGVWISDCSLETLFSADDLVADFDRAMNKPGVLDWLAQRRSLVASL